MSIENKIKEELDNYEIKTSSTDILNRLPTKRKQFKIKVFIPFAAAFAVILMCIIPTLNLFSNAHKSGNFYIKNQAKLRDNTIINNATIELFYGGIMYEDNFITNLVDYSDDEFDEAVNKYKGISDMVENLYEMNENGILSFYEKSQYSYNNINYFYKLSIEKYHLYSKDDFTKCDNSNVIVIYNNRIFEGNIEVVNKLDVIINYKINDEKITISKEYAMDNPKFNYLITNENNEIMTHAMEIEFGNDNDMMLKYSYKDLGPGYRMEISKTEDGMHHIDYFDPKFDAPVEMNHKRVEGEDHFGPRGEEPPKNPPR